MSDVKELLVVSRRSLAPPTYTKDTNSELIEKNVVIIDKRGKIEVSRGVRSLC